MRIRVCTLTLVVSALLLLGCRRSPDKGAGKIGPIKKWGAFAGDRVQSTPAVGPDGRLYVGSADQHLYAFDANGHLQWKFKAKGKVLSPSIAPGGALVFTTTKSFLYAVSHDGRLMWKHEFGKALVGCPPAVTKDGILFSSGKMTLIAHYVKDGKRFVLAKKLPPITSCPVLGPDETLYFAAKKVLHAWDLKAKKSKWSFPVGMLFKHPSFDAKGNLYLGAGGNGKGLVLSLSPDGKERWRHVAKDLPTKGLRKAEAMWQGFFFRPLVSPKGDSLAVVRVGEGLLSLTIDGKKRRWLFKHPDGGRAAFNGQIAISNTGMIYTGAADQHFYAIDDKGKLHYRFFTRGRIFYGPSLSQDQKTVYIGSEDKHFYAFHAVKKK